MTTVRYWAGARAAAGTATDELDVATLAEALEAAVAAHGERLGTVLGVCAFVVDGDPVGTRPHDGVALAPGSLVDVLPPYAGG